MGYSAKWNEIMDKVCFFEDLNAAVWFRGHSSSNYSLHSGLFRGNVQKHGGFIEEVRQRELTSYIAFSRYGASLFNEKGWSQLFLMQHYGMKTRLLDWTESFAVALYFANEGWNCATETARIWMISPTRLNYFVRGKENLIVLEDDEEYLDLLHGKDKGKYPTLKTGAIMPTKKNSRILAQQGVFTVQGNSLFPLENECSGELLKNNVLSYVDLTPDVVLDVRRYLKQNSINHFSMFPDLAGLAKYIQQDLIDQ